MICAYVTGVLLLEILQNMSALLDMSDVLFFTKSQRVSFCSHVCYFKQESVQLVLKFMCESLQWAHKAQVLNN
jgi:hypothetical protein